ncbi:hypothetical protein [Burkholderia sp. Ac-20365]|uniref:hypothetical protein n=1 Tax=Burkholderia sp. Ac-20365 TaxID=2703897 RepID=UPI00197C36F6|nr:hypothetical protein [Burkholderia sp. Ac-20365]MBN3761237.1 hypothetical protein [Burkholderia sp. Ac-20365]
MPRTLSVANKLLSLRGAVDITDDRGELAYRAKGSFSLLSPTWRLYRGDAEVGTVRKRLFSFVPTWRITGELGEFSVRRKVFALRRRYYAVGGPRDGATVAGNIFDLRFNVSHAGETLAHAKGRLLSVRDRHDLEVVAEPELFIVFVVLVLQLDRRDDQRASRHDND